MSVYAVIFSSLCLCMQCRMGNTSYTSPLQVRMSITVNGKLVSTEEKVIAQIPIMVKVEHSSMITILAPIVSPFLISVTCYVNTHAFRLLVNCRLYVRIGSC